MFHSKFNFLSILFFILPFSLWAIDEGEPVMRCGETLGRLQFAPTKKSDRRIIPDVKIETKFTRILGSNTNKAYNVDWRVDAVGLPPKLEFNFHSDEGTFQVLVILSKEKDGAHQIILNLPRGADNDFIDLSLLKSVLSLLAERSIAGEKYEFVLSDPTITEKLNQTVDKTYRRQDAFDETNLTPEIRRPSGDEADPIEAGMQFDANADLYFPGVSARDGQKFLDLINADEDFAQILNENLAATELGETISSSGNWSGKILMQRNSRLQPREETEDLSALFPVEWRIQLEILW